MTHDDSGLTVYHWYGRPIDTAELRDSAVEWLRNQMKTEAGFGWSPAPSRIKALGDLLAMTFPATNPNEGMLL